MGGFWWGRRALGHHPHRDLRAPIPQSIPQSVPQSVPQLNPQPIPSRPHSRSRSATEGSAWIEQASHCGSYLPASHIGSVRKWVTDCANNSSGFRWGGGRGWRVVRCSTHLCCACSTCRPRSRIERENGKSSAGIAYSYSPSSARSLKARVHSPPVPALVTPHTPREMPWFTTIFCCASLGSHAATPTAHITAAFGSSAFVL